MAGGVVVVASAGGGGATDAASLSASFGCFGAASGDDAVEAAGVDADVDDATRRLRSRWRERWRERWASMARKRAKNRCGLTLAVDSFRRLPKKNKQHPPHTPPQMVSDAKKKKAAAKKASLVGSSKSLAGSDDGSTAAPGVDGLATKLAAAAVGDEDAGERSVTCVLTSHPQVRRERGGKGTQRQRVPSALCRRLTPAGASTHPGVRPWRGRCHPRLDAGCGCGGAGVSGAHNCGARARAL